MAPQGTTILKCRLFHLLTLTFFCLVCQGCTSSELDFCTLLSLEEVAQFDSDVVSGQMGIRNKTTPTQYCIYKNSMSEEVFLLSIGTPTRNLPYNILKTYFPNSEGTDKVELIEGVGNSAAALFSDDYGADRFRILIANGDKWSITIRAKGIIDKNSDKFFVLKELANKALTRFYPD
jgi:hypothetical protein